MAPTFLAAILDHTADPSFLGHYQPEELVGRQIVVVDNLQEAVLRGEESQGVLLAASDKDQIILLRPDRDCQPGAGIK